jgi:hypothetical protein
LRALIKTLLLWLLLLALHQPAILMRRLVCHKLIVGNEESLRICFEASEAKPQNKFVIMYNQLPSILRPQRLKIEPVPIRMGILDLLGSVRQEH